MDELIKATQDDNHPITNYSRVVIETDEKNPKVLAVVTNDECETAEGLRARLKPVYGKLTSKKAFPIIVNGEAYERINVVGKDNNELIASISSTEIIGEKGYRVDLVKSTE